MASNPSNRCEVQVLVIKFQEAVIHCRNSIVFQEGIEIGKYIQFLWDCGEPDCEDILVMNLPTPKLLGTRASGTSRYRVP